MSLFSKRVIFSEVKGVVVHEGNPVEGAEIERSFHLATGENGTDRTRTDASGRFSFSMITKTPGLLGLLPHEPVIGQNIVIKVGGKQYMAWQFVKHDYEDNGELDGKPLDLICDLATEPSRSLAAEHSHEKVVTDIKAWKHPTKKIFKKYKVTVQKIVLKEKGKYPVFYVKLPYDPQSSENEKYYNKLYLELLEANGWSNYSLDDEEDGIVILISWDKKERTMHKDFQQKQ